MQNILYIKKKIYKIITIKKNIDGKKEQKT